MIEPVEALREASLGSRGCGGTLMSLVEIGRGTIAQIFANSFNSVRSLTQQRTEASLSKHTKEQTLRFRGVFFFFCFKQLTLLILKLLCNFLMNTESIEKCTYKCTLLGQATKPKQKNT